VAAEPAAQRWHCVTDHLHMHPSASWGRFVAEHDGITEALGQQEQRGMLKSMATRAAFLAAPTQRIVFHSPPNHASWLTQMERWFSIWVRKWLKRASCTSGEALQTQVLAFIAYCNATRATPFQWTYGRKPLSV
jgi:putative transposase